MNISELENKLNDIITELEDDYSATIRNAETDETTTEELRKISNNTFKAIDSFKCYLVEYLRANQDIGR